MVMYLLSLIVVIFRTTSVRSDKVCSSEECKKVSQMILDNLDTTADPCVDIYQYACGGWKKKNIIPEGFKRWSTLDKMIEKNKMQLIEILGENGYVFKGKNSTAVKKLKQFYKSCTDVPTLNRKGAEPLKKLIDEHGSWTVTKTNKRWKKKAWNLQKALENSHKLMGTSFWSLGIENDVRNESRNIISFHQSGLTYSKKIAEYNTNTVIDAFMIDAIEIGLPLGGKEKIVRKLMKGVLKLETKLTKIFTPKADLKNYQQTNNFIKLGEFQKLIGNWINMTKYMDALFGIGVVTLEDEVYVATPDYFRKLQLVIQNTKAKVLANYIMWNLIIPTMGYLTKEFSPVYKFAVQPNEELFESSPRKKKCLTKTRNVMPFVLGAMYVDRHFSQENVVKTETVVNNIKREFINNLNQLTWLDDETRTNLKEKAEVMTSQVGYPDWIMDPSKLDAMYEKLVVKKGEYFQNFINFQKFEHEILKEQLKQPPVKDEWAVGPDEVSAYYNPHENEVVVLAGILQEPVVSNDYPTSYLYGSLGAMIAHEMIHGIDSSGRHYDQNGYLRNMWTPRMVKEFNKRAQCFVDQYNNYGASGHNLSGQLTMEENIADNGEIKLAYRAYNSAIKPDDLPLPGLNLTNDQLYFLGKSHFHCAEYTWASAISSIRYDEHAHKKYRVIGPLSNSREFAKAFNCPVNSPMNPEKKCEVW